MVPFRLLQPSLHHARLTTPTTRLPVVLRRIGSPQRFTQTRQITLSPKKWFDRSSGFRWFCYGCGSVTLTLAVTVGGLLAWDASTYKESHIDRVPLHPLSLEPERGGPKNLKVAKFLVDDQESDEMKALQDKEKLVVLGGGWGGVAMLNQLDPEKYHVTVIAPENYNLFTPLLPSATVGTVEPRSLVEPLRKVVARVRGHYLQAYVVDIDMENRLIEVEAPTSANIRNVPGHIGETENFYIPYDKCVIAVGAVANDHGVKGLENCFQLKTINDALDIRKRIMSNLEVAGLPTTTEEERKKLLSFVVCGGGPTGVEFAAELADMVHEDITNYLPKVLRKEVNIHILQSRTHLLNTYAETISEYAEKRFARTEIDTILNARVLEVTNGHVKYGIKQKDGSMEEHIIPAGFVLWSTGIAMNPLTKTVAASLPNQYHKHALEVDWHLRVKGAPIGTLYALGDCSVTETNLVDYLLEWVEKFDKDNDGHVDLPEFEKMIGLIKRKFPTATMHVEKIRDMFEAYDADRSGDLDLNEMVRLFQDLSSRLTTLPATAQVASQQGKYLGKKLNILAHPKIRSAAQTNDTWEDGHDVDDHFHKPFKYTHLGSLAYLGNSAVLDLKGYGFAGGLMAMYIWRSIYWSEQVSFRTRMLLMVDWIKRGLWGRDLSNFESSLTLGDRQMSRFGRIAEIQRPKPPN